MSHSLLKIGRVLPALIILGALCLAIPWKPQTPPTPQPMQEPAEVRMEMPTEAPNDAQVHYMNENTDYLTELSQNPTFVGEEIDSQPARAPQSKIVMIDGFKVKVPELSEVDIEAGIYKEQIIYTLNHLDDTLLDSMLDQYQHQYATLLTEMGLHHACDGPWCGYRIDSGAFLDALQPSGFVAGDVILSINGMPIKEIAGYSDFKRVLFNHSQQLDFSLARNGEVKVVEVVLHDVAQPAQ